MRRLLLAMIVTLLTTVSFTALGQTTAAPTTETDIKTMLCHKWKLTHMEVQGQRVALPEEMGESTMTLQSDGTLLETSDGISYQGTWTYNPKTRSIETNDKDGKETHKVLKVTPTQLILKSSYEGMPMNMIMKRIN